MHRLHSILVGVDLDEGRESLTAGSRAATRQALWLAQRTGARIEFVHSTYDDPEKGPASGREPGAGVQAELEDLRAELAPEVRASELTVCEGAPLVVLIRRVLADRADLVVVAKRNRTKRDDRRLGSVSMKLVRYCPAPVWVVKPEHELRHRCVLAASDLSPVGDLATDYGAFVAGAEECVLCVVHAWQLPMDLQLGAGRVAADETARRKQEIEDAARQHIRGLASVAGLGERAEILIGCSSPSRAILEVTDRRHPDLVVMGTLSRGGVAGALVGNTAEKLLYRLDCSILTVKPADFVCPLELRDS